MYDRACKACSSPVLDSSFGAGTAMYCNMTSTGEALRLHDFLRGLKKPRGKLVALDMEQHKRV